MSTGPSMWDEGFEATICPHGNSLNHGDTASCGCRLRIITGDGLVIHAGPYDPAHPMVRDFQHRQGVGLDFPEGRVVRVVPLEECPDVTLRP
jgi:hypothetical protein